jgi:ankyrin repeat protein
LFADGDAKPKASMDREFDRKFDNGQVFRTGDAYGGLLNGWFGDAPTGYRSENRPVRLNDGHSTSHQKMTIDSSTEAMREFSSAIAKGDLKTIKTLLARDPSAFQLQPAFGWPVLHRCFSVPNPCVDLELVKRFIEVGGDVNRRTYCGVSLLFLATMNARRGDPEIVNRLRNQGARMSEFEQAAVLINEESIPEKVAKVTAFLDDNPKLVRAVGHEGFTLLHFAVRRGREEIIRLLLERGADPNAVSFNGDTPVGFCNKMRDRPQWCAELMGRADRLYASAEEIQKLLYEGKHEKAIAAFDSRPELVHAWFAESRMLQIAAWRGKNPECVIECMLALGADPNAPDKDRKTALHYLAKRTADNRKPVPAMVQLLVGHGADVNRCDRWGWTPLHDAAKQSTWDGLVKALVDRPRGGYQC